MSNGFIRTYRDLSRGRHREDRERAGYEGSPAGVQSSRPLLKPFNADAETLIAVTEEVLTEDHSPVRF
jgi:hypothetical protein